MTRTALIVGGGIAGPVVAMALQKAGINATVCEAYATSAEGVGGGLSLAPNGLDALDVLGIGELIRPLGIPVTGMVMQDWAGRPLAEFGNPPGVEPQQFFWRGDLHRILADEAVRRGITIEYGKCLVNAEQTADGVTAHFADGTLATADILIGADGIHSVVRTLVDAQAPSPQYTGLISFGGPVNGHGLPSTGGIMPMVFGKQAFLGYQVFDADSGVWFVNLPHPEPLTAAQLRQAASPEEWLRRLQEKFVDDRVPSRQLIGSTDPDDLVIVGAMENMPPVQTWSRGRIVLVGDSVHAPSSSSGQGASLAIESAIQLARCLRDLPYDQAFAAYETERRPRVERVIKETTRKNSSKTAGPVMRVVNAWAIRVFAKMMKPEKMAWMFQYRIDWDAPVSPASPVTTR
jgi:FAD-dependent urate hydroxylase